MSIPKADSRLLHLDGGVYRWRVRQRPTDCQGNGWSGLTLAVEDATPEGGCVLVVSLGVAHPSNWLKLPSRGVTPGEVGEWVQRALILGWQPSEPGRQFLLSASSATGDRSPNPALERTPTGEDADPASRVCPRPESSLSFDPLGSIHERCLQRLCRRPS